MWCYYSRIFGCKRPTLTDSRSSVRRLISAPYDSSLGSNFDRKKYVRSWSGTPPATSSPFSHCHYPFIHPTLDLTAASFLVAWSLGQTSAARRRRACFTRKSFHDPHSPPPRHLRLSCTFPAPRPTLQPAAQPPTERQR